LRLPVDSQADSFNQSFNAALSVSSFKISAAISCTTTGNKSLEGHPKTEPPSLRGFIIRPTQRSNGEQLDEFRYEDLAEERELVAT